MYIIEKVADLVSELRSAMFHLQREGRSDILIARADENEAYVLLDHLAFMNYFQAGHYDLEVTHSGPLKEFPFQFKSEVEDVLFQTMMNAAEVLSLKETHPEHFEHIERVVQL